MLRKGHVLAVLVIFASTFAAFSVLASAEEGLVPSWIKTTVGFWISGDASDQEFINTIEWMLENDVLQISPTENDDWKAEAGKLYNENKKLKADNERLKDQLDSQYTYTEPSYDPAPTSGRIQSQDCSGTASCFSGEVTGIVDGDTIEVDWDSIRFALVDTPEVGEYGYGSAKDFIEIICPVGSIALVDEDDGQTRGSYGRMIAVVYCNGMNLNKAVLDQGYGKIDSYYCKYSEFEYEGWAQTYGCAAKQTESYTPPKYEQPKTETPKVEPPKSEPPKPAPSCDPSYPTVCIPPYPPDLDCGEITYRNFVVLEPDPHGFDGDNDGLGCEG